MTWADLLVAGISAISGGAILKIAEYWLNRAKFKSDQAKEQRDEHRAEATSLREQIKALKIEVQEAEEREDAWKVKYWNMHFKYHSFLIEVQSILLTHNINPKDVFKSLGGDDATSA